MAIKEKVVYEYTADDKMSKNVGGMKGGVDKLNKSIGGVTKTLAGFGAAAVAAVAGVAGLTLKIAEEVDVLAKTSAGLNLNIEDYIAMSAAAGIAGVSQGELNTIMQRSTKAAGENSDAFQELGISVTGANGEMKDQKTILFETLQALETMEPGVQRDALAMQIFGKNIAPVNKLLDEGTVSLAANSAMIEENTSITEESAKTYETMNDKLSILKGLMFDWLVGVLEPLAEFLTNVFDVAILTITGDTASMSAEQQILSEKMIGVYDSIKNLILGFIEFLPYLGQTLKIVAFLVIVWGVLSLISLVYNGVLAAAAIATGAYTVASWLLNTALWANAAAWVVTAVAEMLALWPIYLIIAAVIIVILIYIKWKDEIDAFIGKVWDFIKVVGGFMYDVIKKVADFIRDVFIFVLNLLKDILEKVAGIITGVLQTALNIIKNPIQSIVDLFQKVIDTIQGVIDIILGGLISAFNSIPLIPNIGEKSIGLNFTGNGGEGEFSNKGSVNNYNYNISYSGKPSLRDLRRSQFAFNNNGGGYS